MGFFSKNELEKTKIAGKEFNEFVKQVACDHCKKKELTVTTTNLRTNKVTVVCKNCGNTIEVDI